MPLASIDEFIEKFSGMTDSYWFYDKTVELRFDKKDHIYYLVTGDELIPVEGVTQTCGIVDKSAALVPWGCKVMLQKLLATIPTTVTKAGTPAVILTREEFERIATEAKSAHKERLEDAGDVGREAHDWIEQHIKDELAGILLPKSLPEEERAASACRAALDWMLKHNIRWISTEQKVYHDELRYAGTMDGTAHMDSCTDIKCCPVPFKDRTSLVDWKTSNHLRLEYIMQVAAYWKAFEKEHGRTFDDAWVVRLGKEDAKFDPWHLDYHLMSKGWAAYHEALELTRAMRDLEESQKVEKNRVSGLRKEENRVAKEEALKLACKGASKYQGKRKPACNQGSPCQSCVSKYQEVQAAKPVKTKRVKSLTKENTNGEEVPESV